MQSRPVKDWIFVSTSSEAGDKTVKNLATSHAAKLGWKRRKEYLASKEKGKSSIKRSDRRLSVLRRKSSSGQDQLASEGVNQAEQPHTESESLESEPKGPPDLPSVSQVAESTLEHDVDELEQGSISRTLTRPSTLLDTVLIDPFATFSKPVDRSTSFLLKHYTTVVIPELYASKTLVFQANDKHMKWAMESAASQHAMAYRATWEIQGWQDISSELRAVPGVKELLDPSHFRELTIKSLNHGLRSTSILDVSPLSLAIGFLIIGEVLRGNKDGVRAHLLGLRALVDHAGGLQQFSGALVAPIMLVSLVASVLLQESPAFIPPPRNITSIAMTTAQVLDACPDPELNRLGKAFISSENFDVIGPAYLELILARRRLILFEELCRLELLKPMEPDFEWFYCCKQGVDYELLSKSASTLTPEQNAIRFAILSYTFSTVLQNQTPTYAYSQVVTGQLKQCLDKTDMKTLWQPNFKLLMWVLVMGAHGAKNKPERPWYALQLARCFDRLRLETVSDGKKVLCEFFYLERIHGGSLEELWEEADLLRLRSEDEKW